MIDWSPGDHLLNRRTQLALRIQSAVLQAARRHLIAEEFLEVTTPVVGPVTDPGGRGAKALDVDYYGSVYKVMTSAILYKQALLSSVPKIFAISPNARMEARGASDTNRHLVEFHQIDIELANVGRDEAMEAAERLLRAVLVQVNVECAEALDELGRAPLLKGPIESAFARISHADALARSSTGSNVHTSELSWELEAELSDSFDLPFFVIDYPRGSRGFYDRVSRSDADRLMSFDLLAPEGYGELASGAERESDYERVVTRIRESGENPAKYGWYLKLLRDRVIPPSSGFGLGLERLVRYICGLPAVWEASAFPKVPGELRP